MNIKTNYKDCLPEIKEFVKKYNGECLSVIYINNYTHLIFKCKENHMWKTTWHTIKRGSWCPTCGITSAANKNRKFLIDDMIKLAETRGGKCLSEIYQGKKCKLTWECILGHQWNASPTSIKSGSWCPHCIDGVGERLCRLIFESLFQYRFEKIRPDWLKNIKTGKNLELDGYCKELNIGFEYNGHQHYDDNSIFNHPKNDQLKIELCLKNNTKLFIITEISNIKNYNKILKEIKEQSTLFNIDIDTNIIIDTNNIHKTNTSINMLHEIQKIAKNNGGKCLSSTYLNARTKLEFQCGTCNFIWKSLPNNIKVGRWCPKCSHHPNQIDDATKLAESKNGKCLSIEYINNHTKMFWECYLGHQWEATYNQIDTGSWCPVCFKINKSKSKLAKDSSTF